MPTSRGSPRAARMTPMVAGYPEEARSVGRCLRVVMKEECEHRRYAVRDLAVLEADPGHDAAP